jgi:hypothetical protein
MNLRYIFSTTVQNEFRRGFKHVIIYPPGFENLARGEAKDLTNVSFLEDKNGLLRNIILKFLESSKNPEEVQLES